MYPMYSLLLGILFGWGGWGWAGLVVDEVEVSLFVLVLVSASSLAEFAGSGFDCGAPPVDASAAGGGEVCWEVCCGGGAGVPALLSF